MARAFLGLMLLMQSGGTDVESPEVSAPAPAVATFADRLWCIEDLESGHDPSAVNRSSGARGLLQWLPATARTWGVTVGSRRSEWAAAVAIHDISESFFRSQWPVTARLCP